MKTYPIHPAADCFPMIGGDAFQQMVDDIKANGLIQPIALYQDQVIDGRNRMRACEQAGVAPIYETIDGISDPVAYVISTNLHRRHLTTKQRAAIAAELANMTKSDAGRIGGSKQGPNGPCLENQSVSIEQAAEMMNVSPRSVKRAKKTMKENPEAHESAKAGKADKKPKRRIGWKSIAEECGLGNSNGRLSQAKDAAKAKELIEPLLGKDLPVGSVFEDDPIVEEIRRACTQAAIQSGKGETIEEINASCATAKDVLTPSEQKQLDRFIKQYQKKLDNELEDRITERLSAILPMYAEEYERYQVINQAYEGVLSREEFKRLLSCLHPDRVPDADKRAAMFRVIKERELQICGMKEEDKVRNTLPKTVSDLMKMRRTH